MTTPSDPEPLEEPIPDDSPETEERPEQHGEDDRPADYSQPGGWDDRQQDGTPEAPRPTPEEQQDR